MGSESRKAGPLASKRSSSLRVIHICPSGEDLFPGLRETHGLGKGRVSWIKCSALPTAVELANKEPYDVIVLDAWSYPDAGAKAIQELSGSGEPAPFFICLDPAQDDIKFDLTQSAKGRKGKQVDYFKLGAEDVLFRGDVDAACLVHAMYAALARRRRKSDIPAGKNVFEQSNQEHFSANLISQQNEFERTAYLSQEHERKAIEKLPIYLIEYDAAGKCVQFNEAFERLVGPVKPVDWRDMPLDKSDRDRFLANFQALIQQPTLEQDLSPFKILGRNGLVSFTEGRSFALFDKQQNLISYTTVLFDVSEFKLNEKFFRERESLYRRLVENSRDLIALVDAEGLIIYQNPSLRRLSEAFDEHEDLSALFSPEDRDAALAAIDTTRHAGRTRKVETRLKALDGSKQWYELQIQAIESQTGDGGHDALLVFHDVGHRKRMELALIDQTARQRAVTAHSSEWVMVYDAAGRLEYASPAALRGLGIEHEGLAGGLGADVVPKDLPRFRQMIQDANTAKEGSATYRFIGSSGVSRRLKARATNVEFAMGQKKLLIIGFEVPGDYEI